MCHFEENHSKGNSREDVSIVALTRLVDAAVELDILEGAAGSEENGALNGNDLKAATIQSPFITQLSTNR